MICPETKSEENRAAFNALLTRLGGKPLSETDRLNKETYLASLTKAQTKAYYAAHALLDMHTGSYENINAHLDAQERIKAKLQSRAGERGAVSPDILGATQIASAISEVADTIRSGRDDLRKTFNPTSRAETARFTGLSLRENLARMQRAIDQAQEVTKAARKALGRLPQDERWDFIDRAERGQPQATLELDTIAGLFRDIMDDDRALIQALGTGKLDQWIENYMPRYWEKGRAPSAGALAGRTKSPLEGSRAFLKRRTFEYFRDGLDAGFTPLSDNPIDFLLWKHAEMQKYLAAHRTLEEMKDSGLAQFHASRQSAPDGWVSPRGPFKHGDPLFVVWGRSEAGERVIRGEYYMPEEAARIFENYTSLGLRDKKWFRSYLGVSNLINQVQLGLSFFHGGFVSLDAVTNSNALALYQAMHGNVGRAVVSAVTSPLAPVYYAALGRKMRQEWKVEGSHPALQPIVEAWLAGGGRSKMDDFYKTHITRKMMDAFRQGTVPGLLGGALRLPFAAVEQAARPLMEWLVPNMKAGAIAAMARYELQRLGPDATHEQIREAMARVVDSVDNRMGQMIYDNLFWNKAAKDIGMASVRSLGWNLGDIREFGGGALDALAQPGRIGALAGRGILRMGGGKPPGGGGGGGGGIWNVPLPDFTLRMAYIIALPATVGLIGGTLTWLMTGNKPNELRDYYYPKTGNLDEHGDPERVSLPSYMKDIMPVVLARGAKAKLNTVEKMALNKLHPVLHLAGEMLTNKDYFGTPIRNEDDPLVQQAKDSLAHIGKEMLPFGIRGVQRERARGASLGKSLLSEIGITPAPRYVNQTAAQQKMAEILEASRPGERTKAQADMFRLEAEIGRGLRKGGADAEDAQVKLADAIHAGVLTKRQAQNVIDRAQQPQGVGSFKRLGIKDALDIWDLATDDEKLVFRDSLAKKEPLLETAPEAQRESLKKRFESAIGQTSSRDRLKALRESPFFQSLDPGERREALGDAAKEGRRIPDLSDEGVAAIEEAKTTEHRIIDEIKKSPEYKKLAPGLQQALLRQARAQMAAAAR